MSTSITLTGTESVLQSLRGLGVDADKVAGAALREAGRAVTSLTRGTTPVRSGSLRESMGSVLRKGQSGPYAVVGARRGHIGKAQLRSRNAGRSYEPANYFHLVESGTSPHEIDKPISRGGELAGIRIIKHPGTLGRHMLKRALDASGNAILGAMRTAFAEALGRARSPQASGGE